MTKAEPEPSILIEEGSQPANAKYVSSYHIMAGFRIVTPLVQCSATASNKSLGAAMIFFVLLVLSSAILAVALQKAIAKFVSPVFDLSQRPTREEGPNLDVVVGHNHFSKKDKAASSVLNENKRLKQELLSSQRKCAELEKLLQAQPQSQCNPDIRGSKLNQFPEQIVGMNVFAIPDGECWHIDQKCLMRRVRGTRPTCLELRPCMVCVKNSKNLL